MSASSASAIPYIGSKISLVTNSELRYEGILININTANSTVTLRDVRMSGTENRKASQYVMPSSEVFDFIIFNGKDIKDLTVSEPGFSVKEDPAVVAVNVAPSHMGYPVGGDNSHVSHMNEQNMMQQMQQGRNVMGHHHQQQQQQHPLDTGYNHPPRGYSPVNRGGGGPYRNRDYMEPGRGYRGNRGGISNNSKNVVGELTAQPNTNLKTQVASAFDFEQSNSKFEKEKNSEVESVKLPSTTYDKSTSFFDNISCETLNRQHGRDSKIDREKQRELDTQTFGPAAALTRGPRYYRRGYRRPVGMRGRGGGYGMYRQQQQPFYGGNAYGGSGGYNMAHVHAQ